MSFQLTFQRYIFEFVFEQYTKYTIRKCIVGVSILSKLKRLSTSQQIHLQWIPSHVDLEGNEIADPLAKAGACETPEPSTPLTFSEIFSRTKHQNKTAWIVPPEHHWISVLVLEALWLTDLTDRSKQF
ncbi:RNase H domain-containing protein [Trichonephila clavipes]|nr:RNase H domain-containing protein [Trichonephila clavipes]